MKTLKNKFIKNVNYKLFENEKYKNYHNEISTYLKSLFLCSFKAAQNGRFKNKQYKKVSQ
jgi:hypothetical protein